MKERIQKKADDLFRRYGVKSITMDEIAAQLGISKKTIYQYFSDKDELVEEVVRNTIMYSKQACEKMVTQSRDAIHELFLAADFMNEIMTDMNPAMMYDLERFHFKAFQLFLDYREIFLADVIRANLRRGLSEELYRPDIHIEIITRFRLEAIMLAFNTNIFPVSKFNLAETQKTIIEHFLFGIASLKGYKLILKYQQERNKS